MVSLFLVTDPPTTTATTTTTTTTPTTTTTSASTPISTSSRDAYSTKSTDTTGNVSDGDPDGKEDEKLRTPVILQPPTFLPVHTQKPLAELKAPDQVNCSRSSEGQENGTKDDGKNEDGNGNEVVEDPKRPCDSKGRDGGDPDEIGGPGLSKNDSEDATAKGMWLVDEHGYMIGSRFIKLKNITTDVNESGTKPFTEEESESSVEEEDNVVPEGGLKNITHEGPRPEPHGPDVEIYFSSGPWGRAGYWILDERLGWVWYSYISPGVFELDMETTNMVRGANEAALEGSNREKVVSAPSLLPRGTASPEMGESSERSSVPSGNQDREEITRTADDTASVRSTTQVPSGYWSRDEVGHFVWRRYIGAGKYELIYPETTKQATTLRLESQPATGTVAAGRRASTTARSQTKGEGPSRSTEDGRGAGQTLSEVEYDFWTFLKGKRVSMQYVPPNNLDETNEESRLASQQEFVAVPPNLAVGDAVGNSDGTGEDRRYIEEKRRFWHSSNDKKSGSTNTEEIGLSLDTKSTDANETMAIQLDDEKGRDLWRQLRNLTGGKLNHRTFPSEMKNRFGIASDKLSEEERDGNSSEKTSDHFHESYWFTDETGRRFQVIHKYNKTDDDEKRKPLRWNGNRDQTDRNVPVGRMNDGKVSWKEEETEEHGVRVPEVEGALEYERYGSEYWIRYLKPSTDDPPRQAKPSPSPVPQPRTAPSPPAPPRRVTTRPPSPQEFRAGTERAGDETRKIDKPKGKPTKEKGTQKSDRKNNKQKGEKNKDRKVPVKGLDYIWPTSSIFL